jgi:hypothetical protein
MNALEHLKTFIEKRDSMYEEMAEKLPNIVHCKTCGREVEVNPAECLRWGWPRCCEATMTLGRLGNK